MHTFNVVNAVEARTDPESTSRPDASRNCAEKEEDHPEADQDPSETVRVKVPGLCASEQARGWCGDCATQRPHDGAHDGNRERNVRRALGLVSTSAKAPPNMLTGQSLQVCLRREVPTDHEAHGQRSSGRCRGARSAELCSRSFGGSAPRRPKHEHAKRGRICTQADHQRRTATCTKIRSGSVAWYWSVQQTTRST